MIRIFNILVLALGLSCSVCVTAASPVLAQTEPTSGYQVVGRRYIGLHDTNVTWLDSYLELHAHSWPRLMHQDDAHALESKLLTTLAFLSAKVSFEPLNGRQDYELVIHVEERWTMIPVVRAVYGGGTPLRVLGAYDTHAFGRLITLGAESRKYGNAPPGFVAYAKDPRHDAGRYYLAGEFWRDFRRRSIYAQHEAPAFNDAQAVKRGDELGAVSTNATITRLNLLRPLPTWLAQSAKNWKVGFDIYGIQEAGNTFDPSDQQANRAAPTNLGLNQQAQQYLKLMPVLAYDDVEADVLHFDGWKWNMRYGPLLSLSQNKESKTGAHSSGEVEVFYFKRFNPWLNLAWHGFAGSTTYDSVHSQYFLGGLDTIRGLPDGALYGTKAAYANTEIRQTAWRARYLWIQNLAFVDVGGAADSWNETPEHTRAAAGVGIRLAVPQIYRLVLRVDYAWSIDGSGTRGVTAGLNQFIDPYKPL